MQSNDWRKHLHSGDEVTWSNPREKSRPKLKVIQKIIYHEDGEKAYIIWYAWGAVEVFLYELT